MTTQKIYTCPECKTVHPTTNFEQLLVDEYGDERLYYTCCGCYRDPDDIDESDSDESSDTKSESSDASESELEPEITKTARIINVDQDEYVTDDEDGRWLN